MIRHFTHSFCWDTGYMICLSTVYSDGDTGQMICVSTDERDGTYLRNSELMALIMHDMYLRLRYTKLLELVAF